MSTTVTTTTTVTTMTTSVQSDRRCSTVTTVKRADELVEGDRVLVCGWKTNSFEVLTVTATTLVGDDVEFMTATGGEWTTSRNNTFQVVTEA